MFETVYLATTEVLSSTVFWIILGLACISVLTRNLFSVLPDSAQLPEGWAKGLRYAPIAALTAVIVPEVMFNANPTALLQNFDLTSVKVLAAIVCAGIVYWRKSMGLAIFAGLAIFVVSKV